MDNRGIANRFVTFGLMLILGAFLIAIGDEFLPDLLTRADNETSVTAGETGIGYMQTYWEWMPFVIVGLGFLMVVAGAAFESRRPGI